MCVMFKCFQCTVCSVYVEVLAVQHNFSQARIKLFCSGVIFKPADDPKVPLLLPTWLAPPEKQATAAGKDETLKSGDAETRKLSTFSENICFEFKNIQLKIMF